MRLIEDARMYGRYCFGLWSYLREPRLTWADAVTVVKRRLDQREENFLRVVERGVYGHRRSPYRRLLELAQCGLGDIRDSIRCRGLEATLTELRSAGVYVQFEEFKGRTPMVRDGHEITVTAGDFDNPYPKAGYYIETGGSTGAGTRIPTDLDFFRDRASHHLITETVHDSLSAPLGMWRGILPDNSGLDTLLLSARCGRLAEKWFVPVSPRGASTDFRHRAATAYTIAAARLAGMPFPHPEVVTADEAVVVARWVAETLRKHGKCLLSSFIARLMRVCLAAEQERLDLSGAIMMGAGEPPTPAKVEVITRSGARHAPSYFFSEGGQIGTSCVNPADTNDIHFFEDALAMIQSPRTIPGVDDPVNVFCFTSLLPSAPKLLLNVEIDDFGLVEERACNCPLEQLGFKRHLRHVQSASKLTGEGVTLVGSDMVRVLHEVLPQRFGGTALDYQLQETEDAEGFTRLDLVVSPKVVLGDEAAVIHTVYDELRRSNAMANLARAHWADADSLRIQRREPYVTPRGKLPPLHVSRRMR